MRRQIRDSTGRRGTVIAASAAVLCLGGTLAACGGGTANDGYVAVGAAGTGPERPLAGTVAPSGKVTLVPLDRGGKAGGDTKDSKGDKGGRSAEGRADDDGGPSPDTSADASPGGATGAVGGKTGQTPGAPGTAGTGGTGGAGEAGSTGGTSGGSGSGSTGGSGGAGSGSTEPAPPSVPAPGSTPPAGPAVLVAGAPERAATDERWCEKVTVEFRNTGGSPARSGTVTFATHVIGGLGIDWATVESSAPLPAPIDAGAARTKTYTVCVDAWRVPLGMHVETRDVTAVLK
ncbi:hypothetical protein OG369_18390 [Streptomyces sp. NBC_01221]|uniref:hypothetical protein n=1 Tax=unclassified Streptomyces TaxID=2593676 RepID=UPI0022549C18|nr:MULTISPECIES: hypothetical protein [unclassified Streptomyces]MCX4788074.1 hypothetical protein [Streptomyces sp. NBC_01221]MCX4796165.1 hypothetical protein [Streptomyces sp. NBC_01242]